MRESIDFRQSIERFHFLRDVRWVQESYGCLRKSTGSPRNRCITAMKTGAIWRWALFALANVRVRRFNRKRIDHRLSVS